MIVISPTAESEKYFTELAKDTWTNYTLRDSEVEDSVENGRTLVISCELDMEKEKVSIKLHYRYLRGYLYCFVEEI
jgi:hypothetical protein